MGKELIILGILAIIGMAALIKKSSSMKEKYFFLGFIVLLFTIIYCVSFLKYEIAGVVMIFPRKSGHFEELVVG